MLTLSAKIREAKRKKVKALRKKDILPAVLYGPKIKTQPIEIDAKEFKKIYKEAGESSLIFLKIDPSAGSGQANKFSVLVHEIKKDPITEEPIHIDFYQPILTKEIEVTIPLVFEGEPPAVKELGGTLVKEISELKVRALPQNLPHQIKINVEGLRTFEDEILIKDLNLPEGVKTQRGSDEIVALVVPAEKVEEELEKPIEEKVEEVEKVEEKEKEAKEEEVKDEKKKEEKGEAQ